MPDALPMSVSSLVIALLAGAPAVAETSVTKQALICPERLRTMAVTPTDPARIAGFQTVVGGPTSSQSFLQDIVLQAGSDAPAAGRADGKKKMSWTFDGTTEVKMTCIYEGGVSLTRALGRPKSCTAAVKRSKDYPGTANGWGMDSASLRCR